MVIACKSKAQNPFGDTSITIKFLVYNGSRNEECNFEMISKTLGTRFRGKVIPQNLSCNVFYDHSYTFIFKYKGMDAVVINVCTDTIKKRSITVPLKFKQKSKALASGIRH